MCIQNPKHAIEPLHYTLYVSLYTIIVKKLCDFSLKEDLNFVVDNFFWLVYLPTVICMTRIIRSFLSSHVSRIFLKFNPEIEMKGDKMCFANNAS